MSSLASFVIAFQLVPSVLHSTSEIPLAWPPVAALSAAGTSIDTVLLLNQRPAVIFFFVVTPSLSSPLVAAFTSGSFVSIVQLLVRVLPSLPALSLASTVNVYVPSAR